MTTALGGVLEDLSDPPYPLTSLSTLDICDVSPQWGRGLQVISQAYAGQISRLPLRVGGVPSSVYVFASLPGSSDQTTVVDSPGYIFHFTNLRHLTFANLFLPQGGHYRQRAGDKGTFAWIPATISALRSSITHLTIEILIHQPSDLNAVNWKALDVLLFTREVLRSLVQVSVVFLGQLEDVDGGQDPESIAHPVTVRRLMPMTPVIRLLAISTRGPRL